MRKKEPPQEPYEDYWGTEIQDETEEKPEGTARSGPPQDRSPLKPEYRLHVPEQAGELRVRKLLGAGWSTSDYKKWSQTDNSASTRAHVRTTCRSCWRRG